MALHQNLLRGTPVRVVTAMRLVLLVSNNRLCVESVYDYGEGDGTSIFHTGDAWRTCEAFRKFGFTQIDWWYIEEHSAVISPKGFYA